MGVHYSVLSRDERLKIESMFLAGVRPETMVEVLGRSRATIYRELKRGRYVKRNSDYTESISYSCDLAEQRYEAQKKDKGCGLKVGNNLKVVRFLEDLMINKKYSAYAASVELKKREEEFGLTLSWRTIYNYIEDGVFLNLCMSDLPVKREKKKERKRKIQKRKSKGESIERRPENIDSREEFGHWEMDTVVGKQGKSKKALLVLTERKTRKEIIFLLRNHTSKEVVHKLDYLERKMGSKMFRSIFKSVTVDNGSEFMDYEGMCRSKRNKKIRRTRIFYCHPYSSWERGSNENQNKLIRRFVPKGYNFDSYVQKNVTKINEWMNDYPRELFGGRTADEMYIDEINKLNMVA